MSRLTFIIAKYKGKCGECSEPINPGDQICFVRKGFSVCSDCFTDKGYADEAQDRASNKSFWQEADRQLARRGLTVVRTSSGWVGTRNSRGRCEDAPCCGCCTF